MRDMERLLTDAIVADPPPSLASIYADARVDGTHIRRRFPARCAAIRDRRRDWVRQQRDAVRADRIRQIVEAVAALTELGIYPSRNHMKEMVNGSWLRRSEFETAWRDAVIAHGWGDPSQLRRIRGSVTATPLRLVPSSDSAVDSTIGVNEP